MRSPPPTARARLAAVALGALATLLPAACTSGKHQAAPAPPTTQAPPAPLRVELRADAQGPVHGFDARTAAAKASPGMQRFLTGYLTAAFLDPTQQRSGYRALLALFDAPLRAAARRDLDALSLGSDAQGVTAVRPGPASAHATFLYRDGRAVAAVVQVAFDGSADRSDGSGPVRLRATLALEAIPAGWRIVSYDSHTSA